MKTLLLLRHAKSDWGAEYEDDHERPLSKRGRKAARRMGRFLAVAGLRPDLAVTSTADRARDTLARAARAGGWTGVPVHATDALYEASPEALLDVVRALPTGTTTALLVGHEPTFSIAAGRLVGSAGLAMPTGTLARIELDVVHWEEASFGGGTLLWLIPPRALAGLGLKQAMARAGVEPDAADGAARADDA